MVATPNGPDTIMNSVSTGAPLPFTRLGKMPIDTPVDGSVVNALAERVVVEMFIISAARAYDAERTRAAARTKPEILRRISYTSFKKLDSSLPESDEFKRHKCLELQNGAHRITDATAARNPA